MTDLHTCANCHSFSGDGKTLGLDMDGPQNDKGLYAHGARAAADDHPQRGHDFVAVVPHRVGQPSFVSASCRRSRPMAAMWSPPSGRRAPSTRSSTTSPISRTTASSRSSIPRAESWPGMTATQEAAAAARRRRSALCAGQRRLEPRRQVPGVRARRGERSVPRGRQDGRLRQRSRRSSHSIRSLPHPLQRRQRRQSPSPSPAPRSNGMSNSFPKISPDGTLDWSSCRPATAC